MPRRTKTPAPTQTPTPVPEIVADGELAGFDVSEYVDGVVQGIHEALGPVDLRTAGCALDVAMAEFLAVAAHSEGILSAQVYAKLFAATAAPYVAIDSSKGVTFADLMKLTKPTRDD